MCLRVALIFQINYSSPIILSRFGGQLKLTNCIISDRRIPLLAGIPPCKSREFSRREYSMSRLCNIRHNIPVTLNNPGAYGQCSVFDHNGDKQSAVLGTRYGTFWPLYDQFQVGWLQPLQLWLNAGISLEVPVLVSRDKDWIGLDLFNDDTRLSGHISRPTQVNVSQNCFHSLNNYSSPIILSSLGAS